MNNKDCWLKNNCNHCDCDKFCLRYFKLSYLFDQANISLARRKHIDLYTDPDGSDNAAFDKLSEINQNIQEFVETGKNLYLHSTQCGNGKTSWALRLVISYFNKIWVKSELKCRALFISVPQLLLELKSNINDKSEYVQHIKENILSADIVIWDDIATKSITTFESEHLFSMIDSRINLGKSNIFTSNLSEDELHKSLGDRLTSRINNVDYNIQLKGADKRGI